MRGPTTHALGMLAALALLTARCDDGYDPLSSDADADSDLDVDSEGDGDAAGDGDVDPRDADGGDTDADLPTGPGPITLLVERVAITTERLCDFDGDGSLDNSVADLGASAGEMTAIALSTVIQSRLEDSGRIIMYIPEVSDRATPHDEEVLAIVYDGADLDDPEDASDDFSGEEPFAAQWTYLDACGEPLYYFPTASIDHGELVASEGVVVFELPEVARVHTPAAFGTIAPGGLGAELSMCGYGQIGELGGSPGFGSTGDLSILELMLAGGAPMGLPTLPGLAPDVDLDHDGLESFVLDPEGRIVSCVDGDHTVIDGRDCWQDTRIADAFSLSLHLACTTAVFAGREEGWERSVAGTCTDPPAESLWGSDWSRQ